MRTLWRSSEVMCLWAGCVRSEASHSEITVSESKAARLQSWVTSFSLQPYWKFFFSELQKKGCWHSSGEEGRRERKCVCVLLPMISACVKRLWFLLRFLFSGWFCEQRLQICRWENHFIISPHFLFTVNASLHVVTSNVSHSDKADVVKKPWEKPSSISRYSRVCPQDVFSIIIVINGFYFFTFSFSFYF